MITSQILGNFCEELLQHQVLMVDFFPNSIPQTESKRMMSLSVAFIADYLATLFPATENNKIGVEQQLEIKNTAAYIANELLENSIKYKDKKVNDPIKLGLCKCDRTLVFISRNTVNLIVLQRLKNFIDELIDSNIEDIYLKQLEKGAEENSSESRLGMISLIADYGAQLGWKIETMSQNPEIIMVTAMVQLSI